MTFVVAWLVLFVTILVVEGLALFNVNKSDTLSEQIWWLRTKWWGRIILFPLWAWLTYHFFLEPDSVALTVWWDDWALVGLTLTATVLGAVFKKPRQEEVLRVLDKHRRN